MLQEQDRQKLDGIVQQMVNNQESDANIQMVIEDFKNKYDTGSIHQRPTGISESDVQNAKNTGITFGGTPGIGSFLPRELYNNTVGKVANVGVNAYNLGSGFNKLFQGSPQQARQEFGATRNLPILGPTAPVGSQTGNGDVNIVKSIPEALQAGADVAGVIMGGQQLISKAREFLANRIDAKAFQEALDVTGKTLGKNEAISTLKQSGALSKAGNELGTEVKGLSRTVSTVVTPYDMEVAGSVKGLVKEGALATENISAVNKDIAQVSQKVVTPILESHPEPFNLKTIASELRVFPNDESHITIQSDNVLNRAYNLTKQRMLQIIQNEKQNSVGLWKAQQQIDDLFSQSKNPAILQAWKDLRTVTRAHIIDAAGEAGPIIDQAWQRISRQYEAIDRIAKSGYKTIGTTAIERFSKTHPTLTGTAKTVGKYVGLPAAGATIGIGLTRH